MIAGAALLLGQSKLGKTLDFFVALGHALVPDPLRGVTNSLAGNRQLGQLPQIDFRLPKTACMRARMPGSSPNSSSNSRTNSSIRRVISVPTVIPDSL